MRGHSVAIITDKDAEFKELTQFEDVKNVIKSLENDYKVNLLTNHKISETNGNQKLYLTPFISKDQLKHFEANDHTVILQISKEFFHILSKEKENNLAVDDLKFLNQEQLEIDAIYFGLPETTILPNCPVCIKRLDKSISGINTIKCRDMFHSCCQENCKRISGDCFVCQVLFDPSAIKVDCANCGGCENLWICLICGNLGCGRYKGGHAHSHFTRTGHAFALKLDSHHIWDYTLDKYVHWNIKSDGGTVVDVDESAKPSENNNNVSNTSDSQSSDDFTTAQLESQRAFFEERLLSVKNQHKQEISSLKKKQEQANEAFKNDFNALNHERKIYLDLSGQLQEHVKKLKTQTINLSNELEVEKKISQGLANTIDNLKEKINALLCEKEDLGEQVKDLMKHIEVLDLMGQAGNNPDIVGGKLLIRPASKKKTTSK